MIESTSHQVNSLFSTESEVDSSTVRTSPKPEGSGDQGYRED